MIATLLGAFEAIVIATRFELVGSVTGCPSETCIVVKEMCSRQRCVWQEMVLRLQWIMLEVGFNIYISQSAAVCRLEALW